MLDSNGDGTVDPSSGDAFGLFGVDFPNDFEADSAQVVTGQMVLGVDFQLFDPVSINGTVNYTGSGTSIAPYYVGVFVTTGFDINNLPEPDYSNDGDFWPNSPDYAIGELDTGLPPGTYYVGAYLDVNFNEMFDDGIDPAGFYGGHQHPDTGHAGSWR